MEQEYFKIEKEGTKFICRIQQKLALDGKRFSLGNAQLLDFIQLEKWAKELESGNYKQGQGKLHDLTNNTYCCLGVFRELCPETYKAVSQYLTKECVAAMFSSCPASSDGMEFQQIFVELNDSIGFSFTKIAKVIRIFIAFLQMPIANSQLDMTDIFFE